MSNSRRRAIEFEKSNVYSNSSDNSSVECKYDRIFPEENISNYEVRQNNIFSNTYSKVESGEGVKRLDGKSIGESYSSQEARTHTEHLYPYTNGFEDDPSTATAVKPVNGVTALYEAAALYLNGLDRYSTNLIGGVSGWFANTFFDINDDSSLLIPVPLTDNNNKSYNPLTFNFDIYWKGFKSENILKVEGLKQVSISPMSPIPIVYDEMEKFVDANVNFFKFLQSLTGLSDVPPDFGAIWDALSTLFGNLQVAIGYLPPPIGAPLLGMNAANGFGLGGSVSAIFGSVSGSSNLLTPSMVYNHTFGSQGTIAKSASKTNYMKSETVRETDDQSNLTTLIASGENKRIVERRAVPDTDRKRIKGAEIMWQGELKDIILGTVPLDISFPALAERSTIPLDEVLQVRFGNGVGDDIEVDFWFEINETEIRDDF